MKVKRVLAACALSGAAALGVVVTAPPAQADIWLYEWRDFDFAGGDKWFDCCDRDFSNDTFDNGRPLDNQVTSIENYPIEANEWSQVLNLYRNPGYTGWMLDLGPDEKVADLGALGLNNMASSVRYETQ
ncbi:hypothetical protein [Nonomuraea sp. SYSU D8015]|uniref:hypothetical protein n=1 Tax=Nonomuraea sp. SYSU D8015 TaxID=2593644 RepID=UPI0016616339|nr:hypothetical protein [Nonomuraea sp. SYSU D8015]